MTTPGVAELELASSMLKEFVGADRYGMEKKCPCQNLCAEPFKPTQEDNVQPRDGLKSHDE